MSAALMRAYHALPGPARSAAASLRGWYLRWWRYGSESQRLVEEARERDHWVDAQWNHWREERLAYLLHRAATRVPFYRDLWAARRRRGDHAAWDVLANWPILEKDAVRSNPATFLADDCRPRRMFRERTSGTTGTPLDLWRSRATLERLYALSATRTGGWYDLRTADRRAMLGGQLVAPVSQRRPPFWVWNAALRQLYMSSYHLAPDLIPHYLDALARYRVAYLTGYASSIHALAEGAIQLGRRDLRMRVAITSAEPLLPHQRAAIADAFHCPVQETYGMGENAAAASECPSGTLHQWPEVGWIEVWNGERQAVPGESGEFVCTSLLSPDMIFVRYRVGDAGRLPAHDKSCACGRLLPQISSIEGRTSDLLITRDGRRVFWLNPVFYGLPLRQAQIIQETLERVRIRYAPAPGFGLEARTALIERMRERMGDVEVSLEEVADIPRTRNGKLRPVICEVHR